MAGSLFERLTRGEAGANMDEDESIRQHLLRMFVARQGSVQTLPDYGLPDLNDLTLSRADLIKETCDALKVCINRYEPRLIDADVTHRSMPDSTFLLGFHISAMKYNSEGKLQPWQWDISFEGEKMRGSG
ncbi:MAG: type VI secretion system baseplate subunit TssE [Desulfovibrio sp.]|jgi:type VI secretion system protein|nr:type VI secretion system baseplate subunit TssE [Desulfovibrio sp.]